MSKRLLVFAAAFFLATAAFAQNAAVSVFVTNPGYVSTRDTGGNYTAAWGASGEYWFTPRISAALSVSQQEQWVTTFIPGSNGAATPITERKTIHPLDGIVRYRFAGNERWKPYAGLGVRAVHTYAYGSPAAPRSGAWNYAVELNGGVTLMLTQRFGLDFDGRYVPNEQRFTGIDRLRSSLGLSWRW